MAKGAGESAEKVVKDIRRKTRAVTPVPTLRLVAVVAEPEPGASLVVVAPSGLGIMKRNCPGVHEGG